MENPTLAQTAMSGIEAITKLNKGFEQAGELNRKLNKDVIDLENLRSVQTQTIAKQGDEIAQLKTIKTNGEDLIKTLKEQIEYYQQNYQLKKKKTKKKK